MMQTLYYTTRSGIRPISNVIDLTEYRRRLAVSEGPGLSWDAAPEGRPPEPLPRRSRSRRAWYSMAGELLSSAAVLLTTLLVTIQFL